MSILKSLEVLKSAVEVSVKRSIAAEVKATLDAGFVAWSNTTLLLSEVGLSDLLEAKEGGDIFATPKSLYSNMVALTEHMEEMKENKEFDFGYYAEITGNTLESVLRHRADSTMKPVRAKESSGAYIFPLLKKTQEERNASLIKYESAKTELALVVGSIRNLPVKEQEKLKAVLVTAKAEIDDLKSHAICLQNEVDNLVATYKEIEERFGYILDAETGKRVYPSNEYNKMYSKLIAGGRTTIQKMRKYVDMFMLDSELPSLHSDMHKAEVIFGLKKA